MKFTAPHIEYVDLLPIFIVLAGAVLGVLVEAFAPRPRRYPIQVFLAIITLVTALVAAVIALAASHGYIILRTVVRHLLERLMWKGSPEAREAERLETAVKQEYLRSIGVADVAGGDMADSKVLRQNGEQNEGLAFWENDEGLDELSKGVKEA